MRHWILLTSIVLTLPGVPAAMGQDQAPRAEETQPPAEVTRATEGIWKPLGAGTDGFTWVRLATGEWLKGEIKDLRDGTLEFDSDELNELEYDWDDVTALISSHAHTVTTWGRKSYTGFILAEGGEIRVLDSDGKDVARLRPEDVSSMIQGRPRERNFWGGLLSAGSTVRSGNSDQKDASLLVKLNRRALVSRWDNTATFDYAEAGGTKNQESSRLTSKFDWFLSPTVFVTPVEYEYFRDPFQNIARRHTPGVAVGYDRPLGPATWDLSAGTAWQYVRYASVEAGGEQTSEEWVGRISTNLEWDITGDIEFDLDYAINFPFSDANDYSSNLLSVLSLDLWWNFELDLTFGWDRQNAPRAAEDGSRPRKDDYRLTTGIGWDF